MSTKHKLILMMGGQGVGKGACSRALMANGIYKYIETGAILRAMPPESAVAKTIAAGNLVPDELIAEMIEDVVRADKETQTLLLDGFPRNVPQAEILADMMARAGVTLRCALLLDVADEVVIRRISGRRVCPACGAGFNVDCLPPKQEGICDICSAELIIRKDDKPETVRHRLEVYAAQTFPLIEYYRAAGQLVTVDGSGDDLEWKTQTALQKIRG